MSGISPTEKRFEGHIEKHLNLAGYSSTNSDEYDRSLCLIKKQVIKFIQTTQSEQWKRLYNIHGADTENKVLFRISSEILERGIIDVLRGGVVDREVSLKLCYFEPNSNMNPDHLELCKSNHFTVVRQLYYSQRNKNSIDMVLFLNGLPIITMELKNQLTRQNIKNSENQYRNDRNPKEPLLKFKRCMVHFCVDNNRVSMTTQLSGAQTLFLPYNRDIENPSVDGYRTKYLWEDILHPSSLLDILDNFVHVSKEKEFSYNDKTENVASETKEILVFPRYHQLNFIRNIREQLEKDGVGKNYLVQHATGSGKSYSIGWLSHTLASLYRKDPTKRVAKRMFDTVIVVTDRTVLDDQLQNTIHTLGSVDGVVNGVRHGSQELKRFLEQGEDIIITTIQKFPFISKTISSLGHKKFAVIIDEVHSSQSGDLSRELRRTLSQTDADEYDYEDEKFDYEEMLKKEIRSRGPQQHISFFGFTGTPKEKTLEMFGTKTRDGQFVPFHIYSMSQSINEGFTLDVLYNYTTYKRYFKVKQTKDEHIEIPTEEGRRKLMRYVDSHKIIIRNKVRIILDHWFNTGSEGIGEQARGMIVTRSRKHCIVYFTEINRQLKKRGLNYHCLVGFSGEVSIYGKKFTESVCNLTVGHEGNVPLGLKNPNYRLLVVANKFQTGFDEPLVQSMYVDKKLGGVQCVQTLSRLNRTMPGKNETFVLDFVNEPDDIQKSFQPFYQSTILDGETDPNQLHNLQRQIYNFHLYKKEDVGRFCKIFYNLKRDEGELHPILDNAVDEFNKIEKEAIREDIRLKIQSYIRMYSYLSQIIKFSGIELEEIFVFLKCLSKKLPKRQNDQFDISDAVNLRSLRIEIGHESIKPLVKKDGYLTSSKSEDSVVTEISYDYLSNIIKEVNKTHGINLTKGDEVNIHEVTNKLGHNSETATYMNDNNTEENKKDFLRKQFDKMILNYAGKQLDFYKKMEENPDAKNEIFEEIYSNYPKKAS